MTPMAALDFQPFYVTGLPRSRTAWLSALLSDGVDLMCQHEMLARVKLGSIPDIIAALRRPMTPYSGVSDSGLAWLWPDLPALLPGPILVIDRDPVQVTSSLSDYGDVPFEVQWPVVEAMSEALNAFRLRYIDTTLVVPFDEIDQNVDRIVRHLAPAAQEPNPVRLEELSRMLVEVPVEKLTAGVAADVMLHNQQLLAEVMGVVMDTAEARAGGA